MTSSHHTASHWTYSIACTSFKPCHTAYRRFRKSSEFALKSKAFNWMTMLWPPSATLATTQRFDMPYSCWRQLHKRAKWTDARTSPKRTSPTYRAYSWMPSDRLNSSPLKITNICYKFERQRKQLWLKLQKETHFLGLMQLCGRSQTIPFSSTICFRALA